jgi:hypothetical protein
LDPINTKLLRQLIRVLERMEGRISGPHRQDPDPTSQEKQSSENHDKQPLPIEIRSELRIPVAVREYYEAKEKERRSSWQKVKLGLEILGVASAVSLAVLTYLTFNKIRSQADSARRPGGDHAGEIGKDR